MPKKKLDLPRYEAPLTTVLTFEITVPEGVDVLAPDELDAIAVSIYERWVKLCRVPNSVRLSLHPCRHIRSVINGLRQRLGADFPSITQA